MESTEVSETHRVSFSVLLLAGSIASSEALDTPCLPKGVKLGWLGVWAGDSQILPHFSADQRRAVSWRLKGGKVKIEFCVPR